MNPTRRLIVNADDFGLSAGVNRGIIKAHENGILTSASLMVRRTAAKAAAECAHAHEALSVGLHVDLCEWFFANGEWRPAYEVVSLDDAAAVAAEVTRQLEVFRDLTGSDPTHLDSHQHVHRSEPVRGILLSLAGRLGVVVRGEDSAVRYCGSFYGQSDKGDAYPEGITVEALIKIIRELPVGTTELGCHPGEESDADSVYREERQMECQTLCDSRVRDALRIADVELCSYASVRPQGEVARTR